MAVAKIAVYRATYGAGSEVAVCSHCRHVARYPSFVCMRCGRGACETVRAAPPGWIALPAKKIGAF